MGLRIRWTALNPPPFLLSRDKAGGGSQVHHLCSRILWRHATAAQRVAAILAQDGITSVTSLLASMDLI